MSESNPSTPLPTKAMILGCSGLKLTDDEKAFFKEQNPFGFILFGRNLETADQIKALTEELQACVDAPMVPILIDQEGGRVQRLRPPLADNYPFAWNLGLLYQADKLLGLHATWLMSRLHAFDLLKLGINVDCLPVLDIPTPEGHEVIGKRAYGDEPEIVSILGQAAADGLKAGGVLPVIKHIPGHGRASADTHLELPIVDTPIEELVKTDFAPFGKLSGELMAMTAHVVYSAIDPNAPATTSKIAIDQYIRGVIGFDGLLMSDDVSMNALSGDFAERTSGIFAAGCDVVLHCNGDMGEMKLVANETPMLSGKALERANAVLAGFCEPDDHNEAALRSEFNSIVEQYSS